MNQGEIFGHRQVGVWAAGGFAYFSEVFFMNLHVLIFFFLLSVTEDILPGFQKNHLTIKKQYLRVWRNAQAQVEGTCSSCGGLKLDPQHPHWASSCQILCQTISRTVCNPLTVQIFVSFWSLWSYASTLLITSILLSPISYQNGLGSSIFSI